jgi:hypothetical protein
LAKDKAYEENCVKLIQIKEGTYDLEERLIVKCPISIHGAGQDNTIIQGGKSIQIEGPIKEKEKKIVNMQEFTIKGSNRSGVYGNNGLSFLCDSLTITQCDEYGVWADNTKGRLINCVITQCGASGIYSHRNAMIELEGIQTRVDGNGTRGHGGEYGLKTFNRSSIIHLLFPLTKESVSTNNGGSGNYSGRGRIETVESF